MKNKIRIRHLKMEKKSAKMKTHLLRRFSYEVVCGVSGWSKGSNIRTDVTCRKCLYAMVTGRA